MRMSVVINTYNRSGALRQTLLSLHEQRYRDFEVIVVNGPSTDDTETVLQPFAGAIKMQNVLKLNWLDRGTSALSSPPATSSLSLTMMQCPNRTG